MSRPRFLADHDLNEHIIAGLRRRDPSIEIVRARDIGLDRSDDPRVLAVAASEGFATLSHDVNTMWSHAKARLAAGEPMAGLFMIRQTAPIGPVIDALMLVANASEAGEWAGQIVYLPW